MHTRSIPNECRIRTRTMDYVERPVVRAIMSNLEPCSVLRTRRTIVQAFKRSSVQAFMPPLTAWFKVQTFHLHKHDSPIHYTTGRLEPLCLVLQPRRHADNNPNPWPQQVFPLEVIRRLQLKTDSNLHVAMCQLKVTAFFFFANEVMKARRCRG
jgi:hypothetical protein